MRLRAPRFFRRDFLRKLVAAFFAVLIWLAVDSQLHDFATVHDIPVTLRYEPDKLILERRVLTADVTLRGSRKRLQSLKSTDVRIAAEVPVVPDGIYHYDIRLSPDNVSSLPGTRVASIDPESVRVQLDRIVSRDDVPVRVRKTGELGPGYRVLGVRTVPSTVTVTGPGKILQDITEIVTEPILLDETVIRSFEQTEVRLVPTPRVEIHPQAVLVAYEIAKHSGQQDFAELPIQVMGSNRDLRPQDPLPRPRSGCAAPNRLWKRYVLTPFTRSSTPRR